MNQLRSFIMLALLWIVALGAFIYLTLTLREPSTSFFGLVQSEKTAIRAPEAGLIKQLKVKPGDAVQPGDTLLVLSRPEVERQQREGQFQRIQLNQEYARLKTEIFASIRREKANWDAATANWEQGKDIWEARQAREAELAAPWISATTGRKSSDSLLIIKRKAFEVQKSSIDQEYQLKIKSLNEQLALAKPDLELDTALLANDMAYWDAVGEQQVIRAPEAGWIGEVMVSESELTLKGVPLVEIWGLEARYVAGFIHENFRADIQAGQQVQLVSANNTDQTANATIVRLGNRIVEFPDRLRRAPGVRLWGRETIIQLEGGNPFLIGEKVVIAVNE